MVRKLSNRKIVPYVVAASGVVVLTAICAPFAGMLNNSTVALAMLLVVLFVASRWGSWPALFASVLAGFAYDYFFLLPFGSFAISSAQDQVALAAFLISALTVGELSARAGRRAAEAEAGRRDARSESDYHRGLIEASLDALFIIDRDGKITDLNAAAEAITGRSRTEMLGTGFSDYFTDPAKARAGYERAFREGFVRDYPLEVRRRDGSTIPVRYNASVYRDASGEVAGVFAAARDISALARAEHETRHFASFPQLAPVPIIEFDRAIRVTFMNPAMQKMLGENNIGNPRQLVPPRWVAKLAQSEDIDEADKQELEIAGRTFDERIFYTREFQSLRMWVIEITERKQTEEQLRESEQRYRTLVETMNDGIVQIDEDTTITFVNAPFAEMVGYADSEIIGRHTTEFMDEGSRGLIPDIVKRRKKRTADHYELTLVRRDGQTVPTLISAQPIHDEQGDYRGTLSIVTDLTELKRTEQEVRRLASFPQLSPMPEIEFDRALRVRFMNPAMANVLKEVGQILPQAKDAARPKEDELGDPRLFVPARWAWELAREEGPDTDATDHQEIQVDEHVFEEWIFYSREFQSLRIWASDITARKQSERALLRLNHTLRTLTSANQTLVRATSEQELLQKMCRMLIDVGGYRMAWIGMAENDEAKTVRVAAIAGHDDGYVEQAHVSWADNQRGRGPTGTAIRIGKPQVNRSFATDPRMAPWRDEALKHGYASSVALPLPAKTGAFGALTIYSAEQDAFDPEELKLFIELADNLAYGIAALRAGAERETAVRH